jgi:hypothetical protein
MTALDTLILTGLALCLAHACWPVMLPRTRYTRRGGMTFWRIGRLQLSWCICRTPL